ncbi:BGTF surface domain-containing protein [Halorussus litoreus]|uniref:BGTF surface domain-containing protein n=1 Tax=Halorussus litoreus TaxID=1710536 RepID=UPI0013004AE8|nr:BGTF surface domain-containing protein [Halorussus litoreus]
MSTSAASPSVATDTTAATHAGAPVGTHAESIDASGSQPAAEIDRSAASTDTATTSNVSATVVYEGDRLGLRAAPNQTIRLRTNASPGTTFQIVFRTNGNFHSLAEATATEDGTAVASLDLTTVEAGTDVRVVVRHEQTTVAEAPGVVIDPESGTATSVTTISGTTARPTTTTPTTYDESEFWSTTTTATATTTPTTTAGSPTEEQADGVGIPGFGVPVALVGLLGVLALARRRTT